MQALQEYSSSEDESGSKSPQPTAADATAHLKPLAAEVSKYSQKSLVQICAAPDVVPLVSIMPTVLYAYFFICILKTYHMISICIL